MTRISETLERARAYFVGPTNLVHRTAEFLGTPSDARLFNVGAVPARTSVYMGSDFPGGVGAIAETREEAELAAIAECVERYAGAYVPKKKLVYASARELGPDAVGFDRFSYFAEHQKLSFAPWSSDARLHWIEGQELATGARRFVPAALTYVPFDPPRPEPKFAFATSTGQACHTDATLASLSGLCEAVERDAFMIAWLRKLPCPRIDKLRDPLLRETYERSFRAEGIEYHLVDVTSDLGIATVVCLVEWPTPRGPAVGAGAASRLCPRDAALKAMKEAAQVLLWCRNLVVEPFELRPDGANLVDFKDHVRAYCEPEMRRAVTFWIEAPERALPPSAEAAHATPAAQLAFCVGRLRDRGLEVIEVDLTPPDVRPSGFVCRKVLVPGLVPLHAVHAWAPLGVPRLWSSPEALGYSASLGREINRDPHPFP